MSSTYAENPLKFSIAFILALDFLERFAFNGVIFTLPGYLTGCEYLFVQRVSSQTYM